MNRIRRMAPPLVFGLVLRGVIGPFLLATAAFVLIHLLFDAADRFGLIASAGAVVPGVEYLLLRVPGNLAKLAPVALLAGVMFGFARMNRAGEVVAMQAVGISRLQMAVPLILIAGVATICDFALAETVVPLATAQAQAILTGRLRKEHWQGGEAWIRTRDGFVFASYYDRSHRQLRDVTILHLGRTETLTAITQAGRANWTGDRWRLMDPHSLRLGDDDLVVNSAVNTLGLDLTLDDLEWPVKVNPDDLGLAELDRFIRTLDRRGLNTYKYRSLRDLKFSLPVSCLILAAIGFALSLDPLARHSGFARNIAGALAAGFGYWLTLAVTMSFGKSGLLLPWTAAWLPNLLFASIALGVFLKGEER